MPGHLRHWLPLRESSVLELDSAVSKERLGRAFRLAAHNDIPLAGESELSKAGTDQEGSMAAGLNLQPSNTQNFALHTSTEV